VNNIRGGDNPLLRDVAPEDLPVWLGGTCECPGGCLSTPKGPWCDPDTLKRLNAAKYTDIQSEHFDPFDKTVEEDATTLNTAASTKSNASDVLLSPRSPTSPSLTPRSSCGPPTQPKRLPTYYHTLPITDVRRRAKEEYDTLLSELAAKEAKHMEALRHWSKVQLEMTIEIGAYVINRAASYFDAYMHQKKCARLVTEFTKNFNDAGHEFEKATQQLKEVEQQIERTTDPDTRNKLLWRVCELADEVSRSQRARDHAKARASSSTYHSTIARDRWTSCRSEHDYCTYNCSVNKARIYYETYEEQEELLSGQMKELEELEERVGEAKLLCLYVKREAEPGETKSEPGATTPLSFQEEEPICFDEMRKLAHVETRTDDEDWHSLPSDAED